MENGGVYNETTEPRAKPPLRRRCGCTLRHLRGWRLVHKALQPVSASGRGGAERGALLSRVPAEAKGRRQHGCAARCRGLESEGQRFLQRATGVKEEVETLL